MLHRSKILLRVYTSGQYCSRKEWHIPGTVTMSRPLTQHKVDNGSAAKQSQRLHLGRFAISNVQ